MSTGASSCERPNLQTKMRSMTNLARVICSQRSLACSRWSSVSSILRAGIEFPVAPAPDMDSVYSRDSTTRNHQR